MFTAVWIFGDLWCRIWLAVDVWMCTASILNLCAISLDRYVAVTRPVTYPSIMSTTKAKSLIAGIWVLSFVICFPPLVGWKDQKVINNNKLCVSLLSTSPSHEYIARGEYPSTFDTSWVDEDEVEEAK
uniref:G-protein coupled receptors family 1 profile domain-containing protein n=1 Tax=Phlebotomus papatasi TaxID=29031 RepID=A0A1B0D5K4_PHLPP